jgi:hypothetical protein
LIKIACKAKKGNRFWCHISSRCGALGLRAAAAGEESARQLYLDEFDVREAAAALAEAAAAAADFSSSMSPSSLAAAPFILPACDPPCMADELGGFEDIASRIPSLLNGAAGEASTTALLELSGIQLAGREKGESSGALFK